MPLFNILIGAIGAFFLHYQGSMGRLSDKGVDLDEKTETAFPVFHKIWIALCLLGTGLTCWAVMDQAREPFLGGMICFVMLFPAFLIYTLGVLAYYLFTKAYIFIAHRN
ncbi:MAG: hypothetical protein KJ017_09305 [Alphaproteobacteria bacterium]|nr:hypothetical protein [Alphaproteobacteria bacterium]